MPRSPTKAICPFRLQEPDENPCLSVTTIAVLPAASTVIRPRLEEKPILRLSGDQNGESASSVPATCWAAKLSSLRIQSELLPPESRAVNAKVRPSGERVGELNCVPFGGVTSATITDEFELGTRRNAMTTQSKKAVATVARLQNNHCGRFLSFDGRGVVCELASPIQRSSEARSRAVCQRSSACFIKQRRIVWSSAGGLSGFRTPIGVGSFSRMADATLSLLAPSKARFPVTISYRTAPKEKMSLRPSICFPSICSGDMY